MDQLEIVRVAHDSQGDRPKFEDFLHNFLEAGNSKLDPTAVVLACAYNDAEDGDELINNLNYWQSQINQMISGVEKYLNNQTQ